MKSEKEFLRPLKLICKNIGAPKAFIADDSSTERVMMFTAFSTKLELLFMCWKGKLNMLTGLIEIVH